MEQTLYFKGEPISDANRAEAVSWAESSLADAKEELAKVGALARSGDEMSRIELPFVCRRVVEAARLVGFLRDGRCLPGESLGVD